jgi:hypothetical protein
MHPTARLFLALATGIVLAAAAAASAEPAAPGGAKLGPQGQMSAQGSVETLMWLTPMASVDAMRQAFFRDAGARYGDIVWWSTSDWKNQTVMPSAADRQVYFNFNTKEGPVVIEVQAAVAASLSGALYDAWQRPLLMIDKDRARARKYLLLPPGYKQSVPAGFVPVHSQTYNGYGLLHAPPRAAPDAVGSAAPASLLKLYPLAQATNPQPARVIDMAAKPFDGIVRFDASFLASLARMINEEPVQTHDPALITLLKALGLEKGRQLRPNAKAQAAMQPALAEAEAQLRQAFADGLQAFWPGSHWTVQALAPSAAAKFAATADPSDLTADDRSLVRPGQSSLALLSLHDLNDQPLKGASSYRLRIPANVPVRQFWSLGVYDRATLGYILKSPRVSLTSSATLKSNADGSVDLYFGPQAPADQEPNWIYTAPDREWFAVLRCVGPAPPLAEKTWRLPDIEPLETSAR